MLRPQRTSAKQNQAMPKHAFKLKYAPHFNMFAHSAGEDYVDQLRFAAEVGFTAWEDNGMPKREVALIDAYLSVDDF